MRFLLLLQLFIATHIYAELPHSISAYYSPEYDMYHCDYWRYLNGTSCILRDEEIYQDYGNISCPPNQEEFHHWAGGIKCVDKCEIPFTRIIDPDGGYPLEGCEAPKCPCGLYFDPHELKCNVFSCPYEWQEVYQLPYSNKCGCREKTCPIGHHKDTNNLCVPDLPPDPEPEPEPENCDNSIIEAFGCFADDITHYIKKITETFNDHSIQTLEQLDDISSKQQNNGSTNPDDNNNEQTDPSQLEAILPVHNIGAVTFINSIFPTSAQCPQVNTYKFYSKEYSFSYQNLCSALGWLSNLVMIFALYISYQIIRRS